SQCPLGDAPGCEATCSLRAPNGALAKAGDWADPRATRQVAWQRGALRAGPSAGVPQSGPQKRARDLSGRMVGVDGAEPSLGQHPYARPVAAPDAGLAAS